MNSLHPHHRHFIQGSPGSMSSTTTERLANGMRSNGISSNIASRPRTGSDSSDGGVTTLNTTVDSGRWSDSDDKSSPLGMRSTGQSSSDVSRSGPSSLENQKNRNEDIFIYIPASKPPVFEDKKKVQGNKLSKTGEASEECMKPTVVQVLPKNLSSSTGVLSSLNIPQIDCGVKSIRLKDKQEPDVLQENFSVTRLSSTSDMNEDSQIAVSCKTQRPKNNISNLSSDEEEEDMKCKKSSRKNHHVISSNFMMRSREAVLASSRPQKSNSNRVPFLTLFDKQEDIETNIQRIDHDLSNKEVEKSSTVLEVNQSKKTLSKKKPSGLSSYFFSGTISRSKSSKSLEFLSMKKTSSPTNSLDGKTDAKTDLFTTYKKSNNGFIKKGHGNCGLYSSSSTIMQSSTESSNNSVEPTTDIHSEGTQLSIITVNGVKSTNFKKTERAWI